MKKPHALLSPALFHSALAALAAMILLLPLAGSCAAAEEGTAAKAANAPEAPAANAPSDPAAGVVAFFGTLDRMLKDGQAREIGLLVDAETRQVLGDGTTRQLFVDRLGKGLGHSKVKVTPFDPEREKNARSADAGDFPRPPQWRVELVDSKGDLIAKHYVAAKDGGYELLYRTGRPADKVSNNATDMAAAAAVRVEVRVNPRLVKNQKDEDTVALEVVVVNTGREAVELPEYQGKPTAEVELWTALGKGVKLRLPGDAKWRRAQAFVAIPRPALEPGQQRTMTLVLEDLKPGDADNDALAAEVLETVNFLKSCNGHVVVEYTRGERDFTGANAEGAIRYDRDDEARKRQDQQR